MSVPPDPRPLALRRLVGRLLLGAGAGVVCGFTLRQMQGADGGGSYHRFIVIGAVGIVLGILLVWSARQRS